MHAIWGAGQMSFTKFIVVVDEHVNVHDEQDVLFHLFSNCDPERYSEIVRGPVDILDHAAPQTGAGSKIGFDATVKWPVQGFRAIPGKGAEGSVNGKNVKAVSPGYLREKHVNPFDPRIEALNAQGKTVIYVLIDDELTGAIALADIIRPESKEAIARLKGMGIRCIMLTGDKREVADWVAKEIGALAKPDDIRFTDMLPKTRSGKIMRRLLRELATSGDVKGDTTTLEDFSVISRLKESDET